MPMALLITEQLSEIELREKKDKLFSDSQKGIFHNGLLELICEKENLIDAIRKIKSNGGFMTAGVDNETGHDFVSQPADIIFERIRKSLEDYNPEKVRRVEIPKSNGKKRPLGIPAIIDRVIQTAINNIIEPILEAQMYEHSYGFRPLRSIEHAYAMIHSLTVRDKRHYVVEGDIKGYFDNINHNILINKLWKYGVRDKRLVMIIKKILKAGVQGIKEVNEIGTPQGGTISTLLSNIYLTDFDHWVDRQWRKLETKHDYADQTKKIRALTTSSNLKDGYLIRYADDWVILTSSEENALKWKGACEKYLREELKIELSEEKTLVTDLTKNAATFLGYDMFKVKGKNNRYTLRTTPNVERLTEKRKKLTEILRKMRRSNNHEELYSTMILYNSVVRGLRNFYKHSTLVSVAMNNVVYSKMYRQILQTAEKCKLSQTQLKNIHNLSNNHEDYSDRKVWYFNFHGLKYGLEPITTVKYVKPRTKAQWITPYTPEGRAKWEELNKKSFTTLPRNRELTNLNLLNLLAKGSNLYNLEYFINRPMAFNRDRCECKACKIALTGYGDTNIHHLNPDLPPEKVNKLPNLVTLCIDCHIETHREAHKQKREAKTIEVKKRKANDTKTRKSHSRDGKAKKVNRPSRRPPKEQLITDISTMPMTKVGEKYGVSDNAVRKWCRTYDILHMSRVKQRKVLKK